MSHTPIARYPAGRYYIVHTFPDADAIGSSWLAVRALFPCLFPSDVLEPRFVSFNAANSRLFADAVAVFDIGYEFDPQRLRFDHHQLANPRSICATHMVWDYLTRGYQGQAALRPDLVYLKPLVDLIEAGDACELDARGFGWSATLGLHALLAGFRSIQEETTLRSAAGLAAQDEAQLITAVDDATLRYGWSLLDALAADLKREHDVVTQLDNRRVYVSADGLIWGIRHALRGAIATAFARGAQLVISELTYPLPLSYLLEISAAPDVPGLDVRELVRDALQYAIQHGNTALQQELQLFYSERIYAGRGSPKAPNPNPPCVEVVELAQVLDQLWQR